MYKKNVDYKNHKWYIVQTILNENLGFHLLRLTTSFAGSVNGRALSMLKIKYASQFLVVQHLIVRI
jgi:hypothetical protein